MGIYDNWTYTDLHQLNLDWVLKEVKKLQDQVNQLPSDVSVEPLRVFVTPEMYGAVGDGVTDDTVAIQSAIDVATAGQFRLIFGARKTYAVSRTLFIRSNNSGGAMIDFQEAEIVPLVSGYFTQNYVFAWNTNDCISALTPIPRFDLQITNLKSINRSMINDLHFMFVGGPLSVSNSLLRFYYGAFIYPDEYIDFAVFRNVHFMDNMGSLSSIQKLGSGDNVILDNISITAYPDDYGSNRNLLSIRTTRGCTLNHITNGNIYMNNSQNVSINDSHFEQYSLHTVGSQFVVNNTLFWLHDTCLIDIDDSTSEFVAKTIIFNNCQFVQRWALFDTPDVPAIDLDNYTGYMELNNVYATVQHATASMDRGSQSSIIISTAAGDVQNNSPHTTFKYGRLQPVDFAVKGNFDSATTLMSVSAIADTTGKWANTGTYYYRAIIIFDKTRLIAPGYYSQSVNTAVSDADNEVVRLRFSQWATMMPIRIYRSMDNNNWNDYVDIELMVNRTLYDRGDSINGISWKVNATGLLPQVSRIYKALKHVNEVGTVVAYGEYRNTTGYTWIQGTWTKGDVIINVNQATTSAIAAWVCTDGSTNTFKSVAMS